MRKFSWKFQKLKLGLTTKADEIQFEISEAEIRSYSKKFSWKFQKLKLGLTAKADEIQLEISEAEIRSYSKKFSWKFQRLKLDLTAKAILSWIVGVSCGKRPTKAMTFFKHEKIYWCELIASIRLQTTAYIIYFCSEAS